VVTLLAVGSVMSGVNEARADSGVGGLSAIRRRASFLSVLIGLAAGLAYLLMAAIEPRLRRA
jgi:hypothetical protein